MGAYTGIADFIKKKMSHEISMLGHIFSWASKSAEPIRTFQNKSNMEHALHSKK